MSLVICAIWSRSTEKDFDRFQITKKHCTNNSKWKVAKKFRYLLELCALYACVLRERDRRDCRGPCYDCNWFSSEGEQRTFGLPDGLTVP